MKTIKNWNEFLNEENITHDPSTQQISYEEFEKRVLKDNEDFVLIAIEGSGSSNTVYTHKENTAITTSNFNAFVRELDSLKNKPTFVLVDEDGLRSLPPRIKDRCSIFIIEENVINILKNRVILYEMPY